MTSCNFKKEIERLHKENMGLKKELEKITQEKEKIE